MKAAVSKPTLLFITGRHAHLDVVDLHDHKTLGTLTLEALPWHDFGDGMREIPVTQEGAADAIALRVPHRDGIGVVVAHCNGPVRMWSPGNILMLQFDKAFWHQIERLCYLLTVCMRPDPAADAVAT